VRKGEVRGGVRDCVLAHTHTHTPLAPSFQPFSFGVVFFLLQKTHR
jgi:hypothetical protein